MCIRDSIQVAQCFAIDVTSQVVRVEKDCFTFSAVHPLDFHAALGKLIVADDTAKLCMQLIRIFHLRLDTAPHGVAVDVKALLAQRGAELRRFPGSGFSHTADIKHAGLGLSLIHIFSLSFSRMLKTQITFFQNFRA